MTAVRARTVEVAIAAVRHEVAALHAELVRYGLVVWTGGNVSGRVPGADLFVIKPSGVSYDDLTPESMILCDLDGSRRPGHRRAASARRPATPRRTPTSTGTCPRSAVSCTRTRRTPWPGRPAARRSPASSRRWPTSSAGRSRSGPFAIIGDDSIGRGIVETLRGHRSRAVLMANHGPFTIGSDRQGRGQGRGHGRGRRAHRAHRAPAAAPLVPIPRRRSTASTTATRTSTARPPTTVATPLGRPPIRRMRELRCHVTH